ncbi:hypothetical protein FYJ79_04750 [Sharpea azabuensis]|uniref:Uncharacterized protein n=2 Tax=Sharpea porci TaxID=2652286 RepID=A0A844FU27_9FIRM|nr:hypothetical protein [Sharpea porci]
MKRNKDGKKVRIMKGYNSDYNGGSIPYLVNRKDYNAASSSTVGKVDSVSIVANVHSLPTTGTANSVTRNYKEHKLEQERYYGNDRKADRLFKSRK